jgi:hypothetical protein
VQNENRPVELQFNISLQQIIDLDERNQLLKSNMWLTYHWFDENLVWNEVSNFHIEIKDYSAKDFKGITKGTLSKR